MLDHGPRHVRRNATSARLCALGIRFYLPQQHADAATVQYDTTSNLIIRLQRGPDNENPTRRQQTTPPNHCFGNCLDLSDPKFRLGVCSDGLSMPPGINGYQHALLPPTLQNMAPGIFT